MGRPVVVMGCLGLLVCLLLPPLRPGLVGAARPAARAMKRTGFVVVGTTSWLGWVVCVVGISLLVETEGTSLGCDHARSRWNQVDRELALVLHGKSKGRWAVVDELGEIAG